MPDDNEANDGKVRVIAPDGSEFNLDGFVIGASLLLVKGQVALTLHRPTDVVLTTATPLVDALRSSVGVVVLDHATLDALRHSLAAHHESLLVQERADAIGKIARDN